MHDIEPHFKWRDKYIASEDENSPFYGRTYDEFSFSQKIYNYYIHPQWDHFGSETLYAKILFAEYDDGFAVIELIGEWNDCIHNDIMWVKREIVDQLAHHGIHKFMFIMENVLNFHGDEDAYYEEWYDDVAEEEGWICMVNVQEHVAQEMSDTQLHYYLNFGDRYNNINWRTQKPENLRLLMEGLIHGDVKLLEN